MSAYKLNLPLCTKGVQQFFHVSELFNHARGEQQQQEPQHGQVNSEEEWEAKDILDCPSQYNNLAYLFSWKRFGTKHKSWENRINPENCSKLIHESDYGFREAVPEHQRTRRKM